MCVKGKIMTKLQFEELDISKELLKAVKDMGFEEASPIQSAAIPLLLENKDIIGQAQTGTGKTAAFAIPVIESLDSKEKSVQAIILCPTRELVIQVAEEFGKLLKYKKKLFAVPVYGGQQIDRQLRALKKGAQVVIGTPGRTMDHIRRGSIDMSQVNKVILDEADEMLDMGFKEDIETILKDTPEDRQTVMFSATMEKDILQLTKQFQKDAIKVDVTSKKKDAPKIKQLYFEVMNKNKPELLARLIDVHNIKLSLVFCNTKSMVDELVEILKARGYFADALHGDLNQKQRDKVMSGFRKGTVEILVATDVAGRGIDVNNVEAVFNYDLPRDDEDYIHRIGRTGRAGKSGVAFTFVTGKQIYNLKRIERSNGFQVQRQNAPSITDLEATRVNDLTRKIKETLEQGHLSSYINQVELLMADDYTSLDVAAVLLKLAVEKETTGFDASADFAELEIINSKPRKTFRKRSEENFNKNTKKGRRESSQGNRGKQYKSFDKEFEKEFDNDSEKRPYRKTGKNFDKGSEKRSYRKSDKNFDKDSEKRSYRKSDKNFDKDSEKRSYRKSDKNFDKDSEKKPYRKTDKKFDKGSDKKRTYKKSDKSFDKESGKKSYRKTDNKSEKGSDKKKKYTAKK